MVCLHNEVGVNVLAESTVPTGSSRQFSHLPPSPPLELLCASTNVVVTLLWSKVAHSWKPSRGHSRQQEQVQDKQDNLKQRTIGGGSVQAEFLCECALTKQQCVCSEAAPRCSPRPPPRPLHPPTLSSSLVHLRRGNHSHTDDARPSASRSRGGGRRGHTRANHNCRAHNHLPQRRPLHRIPGL